MKKEKLDRPLTDSEKGDCERFAKLFDEREESQGDLGHAIGLSQDMVSKMKRGVRAITIDCAIALSNHWGVAVNEISPEIQQKINSAYNSKDGGNIGPLIQILQKLDAADLSLAEGLLSTVINRKTAASNTNK